MTVYQHNTKKDKAPSGMSMAPASIFLLSAVLLTGAGYGANELKKAAQKMFEGHMQESLCEKMGEQIQKTAAEKPGLLVIGQSFVDCSQDVCVKMQIVRYVPKQGGEALVQYGHGTLEKNDVADLPLPAVSGRVFQFRADKAP